MINPLRSLGRNWFSENKKFNTYNLKMCVYFHSVEQSTAHNFSIRNFFYWNINNKTVYCAHVIVSCWIYVIHFTGWRMFACVFSYFFLCSSRFQPPRPLTFILFFSFLYLTSSHSFWHFFFVLIHQRFNCYLTHTRHSFVLIIIWIK